MLNQLPQILPISCLPSSFRDFNFCSSSFSTSNEHEQWITSVPVIGWIVLNSHTMPQLTKHLIPRIKLFQLLDSVSIDDQTAAESWVICSSVVLEQELENGASKKKKCVVAMHIIYIFLQPKWSLKCLLTCVFMHLQIVILVCYSAKSLCN